MRLICPNCGAQYEVPDEVIPESGRDVQCSDCGDTWFQHHPDNPQAAPPEELEDAQADWDQVSEETESDQEGDSEEPETQSDQTDTEPQRRELDPSVTDVLREEASREETARAADRRSGIETQPDLGLGQPADKQDIRSQQARARMAMLRGNAEDTAERSDHDIDPSSRKNLLPDIEDISSSLDAGNGQIEAKEVSKSKKRDKEDAEPKGKGFGKSFRLVIILVVLAVALYIFAPKLAEMVPALADPLASYVDAVNNGRAALNNLLGDIPAQIKSLISGS